MNAINMNVTTYEEIEALIARLEALPREDVVALVNATGRIKHFGKASALKRLRERLSRRLDRARPVNGLDCVCG